MNNPLAMHRKSRGQINLIAITIVALLAVVAVVGLAMSGRSETGRRAGQPDVFAVKHGDFDISLPVSGELAALRQIEIRNNLDNRAIITEIIPEGTLVQAGQVVLRLNDDEIRAELREAQDKVNTAESDLVMAQAKYDTAMLTRNSELAKADLAIKLADLALKAWKDGEDRAKRQELSLAIKTAQKEYDRLKKRYDESHGLLEKKFISEDEYRKDEIAMMQAESDLQLAVLAEQVYLEYLFEQDHAQKHSDLEQAQAERKRVEQEHDAEVRAAKSDVESKQYKLDSAREELAELKQQLAYCTVQAPSAGLVVYYSSLQQGGWRNEGRPPQVGTELSRNEPVMILPDTSQMVAAVKVSETLSGSIQPKQRATVISDALPGHSFHGEVMSVGVLAESGGWRDPNRREYTVKILLHGTNEFGLKPAMRCKANIYVGQIDNALHIPVQSVFRAGSVAYVYVPEKTGYGQRKVMLGRSSELFIEVLDGLNEGDVVLLRQPEAEEIVSRIELPREQRNQRRGEEPNEQESTETAAAEPADQTGVGGENLGANDGVGREPASGERGGRRERGTRGMSGGEGDRGHAPRGDDSANAESAPATESAQTTNEVKPALQ